MNLNIENTTQIYVLLLDEGVDVWRPVPAIHLGSKLYKILPTADYNAEDEKWQFLPESLVECNPRILSGNEVLVAAKLIK